MRARSVRSLFATLILSVCLMPPIAQARPPCLDYLSRLHWLGRIDVPQGPISFANVEPFTFILTPGSLYRTVLAGTTSSDWISVGAFGGSAMQLNGDRIYVADGAGLIIVDVADPMAPAVVGTLDTPGPALDVAASDPAHVCIAGRQSGIRVVNVLDPDTPVEVGALEGINVRKVDAYSQHVYAMDLSSLLHIVDVTDPTAPTLVRSMDLGAASDVLVRDGYAYVSSSTGLHTLDLSDPGDPVLASSFESDPEPLGSIFDLDDVLAVRFRRGQLLLFDRTDPAHPQPRGVPGVGGVAGRRGDFLYTVAGGLQVFDISHLDSADEVCATVPLPAQVLALDVNDGLAVLGGHDGIQLVSTTADPPALVSHLTVGGRSYQIDVRGGLACLGAGNGLHLVDVTDPMAPQLLASVLHPNGGLGLARDGAFVYVANGFLNNPFWVVDISVPTAPAVVGSIYLTDFDAGRLAVRDGYVYVAGPSGLGVMDVTVPSAPVLRTVVSPSSRVDDVLVSGDHLFAARGDGLFVYNLAEPSAPVLIGHAETPGAADRLEIDGDTLYIIVGSIIAIFDVSDPTAPVPAGSRTIPPNLPLDIPADICLYEGVLYVPALLAPALHLVPLACTSEAVSAGGPAPDGVRGLALGRPQPNPFSDSTTIHFQVPRRTTLQIAVFDVAGRRVNLLAEGGYPPGGWEARWDGRDQEGRRVAPGVYFVRLAAEETVLAKKVTVMNGHIR